MTHSKMVAGRVGETAAGIAVPRAKEGGAPSEEYAPRHRQSLGEWWSSSVDDDARERRAGARGIPIADMMPQEDATEAVDAEPQVRYVLDVRRVVAVALVPLQIAVLATVVPPVIRAVAATGAADATPSGLDDTLVTSSSVSDTTFDWAVPVSFADAPEQWDWLCYDQGDERWGDLPYQTGSIAGTGCGACAAAHALTMLLDEEITPDALSAQMQEYSDAHGGIAYGTAGTVWAGWEQCLKGLYGDRVSIDKVDATPAAVRKAVTEGKVVVYNVPAGFSGIVLADGETRTTYGGHVLACYRYADGHFYVKDSSSQANGHGLGNRIRYTEDEFADSMAGAKGHLGYVYALGLVDGID